MADEPPPPTPVPGPAKPADTAAAPGVKAEAGTDRSLTEADFKSIVSGYIQGNPGIGLPPGVQMSWDNGFVIRSTPYAEFKNWDDESRIPFELRIHGRIQADYYYYKVTDRMNHLLGTSFGAVNAAPDFDEFLVKHGQVFFEGTVFDPNLRFNLTIDANTRGLSALTIGTGVVGTGGVPGGNPNALVDHGVRLFNAFVAYDFHPWSCSRGGEGDYTDGTHRHTPTLTLFAGKVQPFFGLEEILGQGTEQFIEFSMADWFFDADDNNQMTGVGAQFHACDDRLFAQLMITNGNESQTSSLQLDNLPGFQVGCWYDFGGTWNEVNQRWILFGDSISDIDYSCHPVLRVGAATNFVPMSRRTQYSDAELNRVDVVPGAPGGSPILTVLNGGSRGTPSPAGVSPFALDALDSYTYDLFLAGKWRGFSLYNEWWLRNLDNFRGEKPPGAATGSPILYTSPLGGSAVTSAALFPRNIGVIDYGCTLQGGYFLLPKKLEIAGRWSWIRGQSGDINGRDTRFTLVSVAGVPGGSVKVIDGAFRNFQEVSEWAVGVNYYFYRQKVKWQNDFSVYNGGNPALGGQSAAGFIPGVDGWMVRSQIQLEF
jgi:hypothetical protein